MNAELAALHAIKEIAAQHGEVFLVRTVAAVVMSRAYPTARPVGAIAPNRNHMTRERARAIVRAIDDILNADGR